MPIFNRITLAVACLSLSVNLFTNEVAQAQNQNLVLEDNFDAAFLITSPAGTVASHEASSLIFGQTTTSVNSNFSLFPNLILSTQLQQVVSSSYDLNFFLTTGSNSGFILPGTTLRGQAVNQWIFDLSNFFAGINNGIDFPTPVTYNSAQGSWFDDGSLVFQTSYLPQLNVGSTSTQLAGQFDVGLTRGDLGAFGNGIDAFTLKVNITSAAQINKVIPESSTITALLIYVSLGLTLARRYKPIQ
ncbi:hypothetical protein I8751_28785 [Nostocaceae cyanobacterium CENA357]|uniref:PEP-CTERM sorting domain-containing protein n=1 Tax=Atlanticothrix silvestris CENA357 TaxID=1725252 RepID=A0A8J7L5Q4_9CYAN|nr:hypothetical protein [Atlanticothrix silvestris]MBH8556254.1 hypothetical protein [Atlanticothrix silvestris CENA357]